MDCDFVLLLRSLELTGGDLVAIDGAFFDGNASKSSILTQGHMHKQLAAIEADIEACELAGVDAYVPTSGRRGRPAGPGRLARKDFVCEPEADVYHCPAGESLKPRPRLKLVESGENLTDAMCRPVRPAQAAPCVQSA